MLLAAAAHNLVNAVTDITVITKDNVTDRLISSSQTFVMAIRLSMFLFLFQLMRNKALK